MDVGGHFEAGSEGFGGKSTLTPSVPSIPFCLSTSLYSFTRLFLLRTVLEPPSIFHLLTRGLTQTRISGQQMKSTAAGLRLMSKCLCVFKMALIKRTCACSFCLLSHFHARRVELHTGVVSQFRFSRLHRTLTANSSPLACRLYMWEQLLYIN